MALKPSQEVDIQPSAPSALSSPLSDLPLMEIV
jgi:hypothetical protein